MAEAAPEGCGGSFFVCLEHVDGQHGESADTRSSVRGEWSGRARPDGMAVPKGACYKSKDH